jgi:hypothetical protein
MLSKKTLPHETVYPNFPNFLCNCPDFFFLKTFPRPQRTKQIKNYAYPSQKSHRKKHFQFFANFPIFRATFPFFFNKNLIRTITNIKKKRISQIGPAVPIEKSTFSFSQIFEFSGQLFQFLFP